MVALPNYSSGYVDHFVQNPNTKKKETGIINNTCSFELVLHNASMFCFSYKSQGKSVYFAKA